MNRGGRPVATSPRVPQPPAPRSSSAGQGASAPRPGPPGSLAGALGPSTGGLDDGSAGGWAARLDARHGCSHGADAYMANGRRSLASIPGAAPLGRLDAAPTRSQGIVTGPYRPPDSGCRVRFAASALPVPATRRGPRPSPSHPPCTPERVPSGPAPRGAQCPAWNLFAHKSAKLYYLGAW